MYRTLIADDAPEFRDWLRGSLEGSKEFLVIGEAKDGEETLTLTRELRPDLLVADIFIPKLQGTIVAQTLSEELPNLRIILVSAYSSQVYEKLALDRGAIAFIPKINLTPEVLGELVRQER